MKLAEATALADLRLLPPKEPRHQTRTAQDLAEEVFTQATSHGQPFLYQTPDSWRRKWLPSKKFQLMRLPLNAAALPCPPKVPSLVLKKIWSGVDEGPILVDANKNKVGRTVNGFTPAVCVIDGKHRFVAAGLRGDSHILAWVGEEALEIINAQKERYINISSRVHGEKDAGKKGK